MANNLDTLEAFDHDDGVIASEQSLTRRGINGVVNGVGVGVELGAWGAGRATRGTAYGIVALVRGLLGKKY